MWEGITTAGLLVGGIIGFFFGMIYAITRRAWRDFNTAKKAVPGLQKTAWSLTWKVVRVGTAIAAGLVVWILVMVNKPDSPGTTSPAGVVSPSPARSVAPR